MRTGSALDLLDWQPHICNEARHKVLVVRYCNVADPFQIANERDM